MKINKGISKYKLKMKIMKYKNSILSKWYDGSIP